MSAYAESARPACSIARTAASSFSGGRSFIQ